MELNGNQLVCERCKERVDLKETPYLEVIAFKREHRHTRGREPHMDNMIKRELKGNWNDNLSVRKHVGRMAKADIQL